MSNAEKLILCSLHEQSMEGNSPADQAPGFMLNVMEKANAVHRVECEE